MDVAVGDTILTRKKHPCGASSFEVLRVGMDFKIRCTGCGREVMLPREGVYGAYGIVDGVRYAAAVNVGVARSFAEATAPVEAHLLDFDGDLYGREIRIEFEEWLRGPRVFETKDELIETVMGNITWVREHLGGK